MISLVSIVIPVYNAELYLADCLESIINQTHKRIEVICVDDYSQDGSLAILQKYSTRISHFKIVELKTNAGSAKARNIGMEHCTGEYVRFVDADDTLPFDSTKNLLDTFLMYSIDAVRGGYKKYLENGLIKEHIPEETFIAIPLNIETGKAPIFFYGHWSYMFRRSALVASGARYDEEMRNAQDNMFLQNIFFKLSSVALLDKCVYEYRVRQNSATTKRRSYEWYWNVMREKVNQAVKSFEYGRVDIGIISIYRAVKNYFIPRIFQEMKELKKEEQLKLIRDFGIFLQRLKYWDKLTQSNFYKKDDNNYLSTNKFLYRINNGNYHGALDIINSEAKETSEENDFNDNEDIIIKTNSNWLSEKIIFNKSSENARLFLGEQRGFSNHRSGWSYAMRSIVSLHNDNGIYFDGYLENTFLWQNKSNRGSYKIPYTRPWIGVVHSTFFVPIEHKCAGVGDLNDLFSNESFRRSLIHCKGLYVLSNYLKDRIHEIYPELQVNVVLHPTSLPDIRFEWGNFINNNNKKIIQIGYSRRNINSIYRLDCSFSYFKKYRLVTDTPNFMKLEKVKLQERLRDSNTVKSENDVVVLSYVNANLYDRLLGKNIVFIDLYDSSANNTIIECIVRCTPVLVNRIEPVVEYLGEEYPLYYDNLSDCKSMIIDFTRIRNAYDYLTKLNQDMDLSGEYFCEAIKNSLIYQSID